MFHISRFPQFFHSCIYLKKMGMPPPASPHHLYQSFSAVFVQRPLLSAAVFPMEKLFIYTFYSYHQIHQQKCVLGNTPISPYPLTTLITMLIQFYVLTKKSCALTFNRNNLLLVSPVSSEQSLSKRHPQIWL